MYCTGRVAAPTLLGVHHMLCFLEEETEAQGDGRLVLTSSAGRRAGDLTRLPGTAACPVCPLLGGSTWRGH